MKYARHHVQASGNSSLRGFFGSENVDFDPPSNSLRTNIMKAKARHVSDRRSSMLDDMESHKFNRDSQLMFAVLQVSDDPSPHCVIVRNLSPCDLVVEGNFNETVGTSVSLVLPNIGAVDGRVSWSAPDRFGVQFTRSRYRFIGWRLHRTIARSKATRN